MTQRILELLGNIKHLLINLLYTVLFKKNKKAKTKKSCPGKFNALSQVSHHERATRLQVSWLPRRAPSSAPSEREEATGHDGEMSCVIESLIALSTFLCVSWKTRLFLLMLTLVDSCFWTRRREILACKMSQKMMFLLGGYVW